MSTYQEQLARCKDATDDCSNIWSSQEWTIADYEALFEDIARGYIIQGDFDNDNNTFIINPDFEEDKQCEVCGADWRPLYDYWWAEQGGTKWKLCEQCGIDQGQEKCE